jgi:two-component system, OmpR family, phosphate regulon sensor histidine kinase PhoR
MHPLRILLYVSLVVAIAIGWAFGAALERAGVAEAEAWVLGLLTFAAFMVPWLGVSLWALRRARDLDRLTDLARLVSEGQLEASGVRTYHAELDELGRGIEEMRAMIVRQRRAYEEHRAAMQEIVSSLGEGIIAVDPKGRVVVANPRVAEMFGAEGTLIGRPMPEVVRKQPVLGAIDMALRGQASAERVEAGERQIEVRVFPVAASPEIAAVALFIDVTAIERLQRIRRDFLDDFSHEVRTPLAGLHSAAETLEQGGLTREDEEKLRHVIARQIGRIERLVDDLSELNRIESGQLVLDRAPLNLREFLAELADDFRGVVVGGEQVVAPIDAARAQQIFTNILDNAVKHGGGAVAIDLAREDAQAVVRISDEGPGIPPAELERIFHRFYRVDRSRSQPGTGLGLAIAKHLVAAHGGSVRAYNRAEGGATFEVRLPL